MRWEATEARLKHFGSMLVDEGSCRVNDALRLVFLLNGDGTGDSISDIDRGCKLELHSRSQEANHASYSPCYVL